MKPYTMPAALAVLLVLGCAAREYQIKEQPLAESVTDNEAPVTHSASDCELPPPDAETAYEFLADIAAMGHRRSGTPAYRCAEIYTRDALEAMGYKVFEIEYIFPYYEFDPADFTLKRLSDGLAFDVYPIHFSAPLEGELTGKVKRPHGNLAGAIVLVDGNFPGRDIKKFYAKWKKAGAVAFIREADLSPLAAKGLLHSSRAHATSWHYAPLPGFVVADAGALVGETVVITGKARIARGTGINVVAEGPPADDGYVLLTAHLDSWFEGALDDGSGVAVLLEVARRMRDDSRGLRFLVADSEEIGLIGSAAYAQRYGTGDVKAVVELDMVSTKNNYGGKSPETASPMPRIITSTGGLKPMARRHYEALPGNEYYVSVPLQRSIFGMLATDMEWFYAAGVPGVFVYTPSYYYHTERDTIEWIDPADIEEVARTTVELTRDLRESELPVPREVILFDFEAAPGEGATVEFEVKIPAVRLTAGRAAVEVIAFFEQGYEDKIELAKGADGVWRGQIGLTRPGDWQFLAVVKRGAMIGKRWSVLSVTAVSCPGG